MHQVRPLAPLDEDPELVIRNGRAQYGAVIAVVQQDGRSANGTRRSDLQVLDQRARRILHVQRRLYKADDLEGLGSDL